MNTFVWNPTIGRHASRKQRVRVARVSNVASMRPDSASSLSGLAYIIPEVTRKVKNNYVPA